MSAVAVDEKAALDTWARWSKRVLSELGWPPVNIISRIIRYGLRGAAQQSGIKVTEVDEVAELVESAVMRLLEREREAVMRHYLLPEPDYLSAGQMGITKQRFSQLLADGERSVRDFLSGAVELRNKLAYIS